MLDKAARGATCCQVPQLRLQDLKTYHVQVMNSRTQQGACSVINIHSFVKLSESVNLVVNYDEQFLLLVFFLENIESS